MAALDRIALPNGSKAARRRRRKKDKRRSLSLNSDAFIWPRPPLRGLSTLPSRENLPDTVGTQPAKSKRNRPVDMGIKRTCATGPGFTHRTMTLTPRPREGRARAGKSKGRSIFMPAEDGGGVSTQATKAPTLGPGTRLLPGDVPKHPVVIDDSDGEAVVLPRRNNTTLITPEVTPQSQYITRSHPFGWLRRDMGTFPKLELFRYQQSVTNRSDTPLDEITDIFHIGHGFTLKKAAPSFDIPVLSSERQPVSE
jgi:hypothetical protein